MWSNAVFSKTAKEVSVPVLMSLVIDVARQIQDRKTVDDDMLEYVSLIEIGIAEIKSRVASDRPRRQNARAKPDSDGGVES